MPTILIRRERRVIESLRRYYGGEWRYDATDGHWHTKAFSVYRCAVLAPRFDGDDDSFVTQYRRSDTGAVVLFL